MSQYEEGILERLGRIADALEVLAGCVKGDNQSRRFCMEDVKRGEVYKTHLGEKLSSER